MSRWDAICLGRREFLALGIFGPVGLRGLRELHDEIACCTGDDPLACIGRHHGDVLEAIIAAQLQSLWQGPPEEQVAAVGKEVLRFVAGLERPLQRGLCAALILINFHALRTAGCRLSALSVDACKGLLNQGEHAAVQFAGRGGRRKERSPLIRWEEQFVLHAAISAVSMATRLIISSRPPARRLAGLTWSAPCRDPRNLAHVPRPEYPDLDVEYDVCVIGSGVGGAVTAARAAEAGRRVLLLDQGDWVSPDQLPERGEDANGRPMVQPARGDVVLSRLYQFSGVQLAGDLPVTASQGPGNARLLQLQRQLRQLRPQQTVNVLQARVMGGGPYINNAIHLEIAEDVWTSWGPQQPAGISYAQFDQRMQQVKRDLGVNDTASRRGAGARTARFVAGCTAAGLEARAVPVSILPQAKGCGSDNSVDAFGDHTGGLHPFRPQGPNSYFMRALHAAVPARTVWSARAIRLEFAQAPDGAVGVCGVTVEDRRGIAPGDRGPCRTVRAKQYVLAAGPIASTKLLLDSLRGTCYEVGGLGDGFSGNVVMPIYAVYDKPFTLRPGEPEPGVTQCYYVQAETTHRDGRRVLLQPAIENWFHYPGTIEAVMTGWFEQYAELVRHYNHLAIAGMVVPTKVRPANRIDEQGRPHLGLDEEEFELLLRGVERIGRIYFAAAAPGDGVTIHVPTKGLLLDADCLPCAARNVEQLQEVLRQIRCRGPEFLQLATAHPQGGNPLGTVVDRSTFCLRLTDHRQVGNLRVIDASVFPAGCEVNPQLTLHALAHFAADRLLAR